MRRIVLAGLAAVLVAGCSTDTPAPAAPPNPQDTLTTLDDLLKQPCATRAIDSGSPAEPIADPWTCKDYVRRLHDLDGPLTALGKGDAEFGREVDSLRGLVTEFRGDQFRCGETNTPMAAACGELLVSIRQALGYVRDETSSLATVEPTP
ncbi:hypothetical protein [Actinokineospora sp. NBRC 105648]|uniref:hypothetical protein n=1 Tax=Actinokineospora sp. NBRC 105648 TaxID=3032206 RepID=UPI0024A50BBD|nr:hypothetical protein [Actinokineospora sp. NBRC 105648]GLZ38998.1 hypothetical protein Acsp05_26220 [Actinokineospora sp. NBRC 105648]